MPMPLELQIANSSPDVDVLLVDRSWDKFDDYENELADGVPMEQSRDKFMSFICAINANLKLDYHEVWDVSTLQPLFKQGIYWVSVNLQILLLPSLKSLHAGFKLDAVSTSDVKPLNFRT